MLILMSLPDVGEKAGLLGDALQHMDFDYVREDLKLPVKFTTDFKVILEAVGQQSIGSLFNCPFCYKSRREYRSKRVCELRTFQMNCYWYFVWANVYNMSKARAMDCYNCVREPLGCFPSKGIILDEVPPPELHILIGIFNDCYDMIRSFDEIIAEDWTNHSHTLREDYWGGTLEGNECFRLLVYKLDLLRELLELAMVQELQSGKDGTRLAELFKIEEVLQFLEAFRPAVISCFGWGLHGDYEALIAVAQDKYLNLSWKPSVTLKMHVFFEHVGPYCKKHGRGLGLTSEQTQESLHAKFADTDSHVIKDCSNPNWAPKKLMSVAEFNALSLIP